MDGPWSAPRCWPGATVVCLSSGPSLTQGDVNRCGDYPVIAINSTYLLADWADVLYACDGSWWERNEGAPGFRGLKVAGHPNGVTWGARRMVITAGTGIDTNPCQLRSGGHSGYQAINLAYHFGASRIILLGYDMCASGGRHHWHPPHVQSNPEPPYARWRKAYDGLADELEERGVTLLNATRCTALWSVPRVRLDEVL